MVIDGHKIDLDQLSEDDKQVIANFQYVKQRAETNKKVLQDAAKDSVVLEAAFAHLAKAVEDIVQRCVEEGEADDASKAD